MGLSAYLSRNKAVVIKNNTIIDYKNIDTTRNTLETFHVFADFIDTVQIGDRQMNLLRTVNVSYPDLNYNHIFLLNAYIKVKRTKYNRFGFTFKEKLDGNDLDFNSNVSMLLEFQ